MTYEEISKAHHSHQEPEEIQRHEELFEAYLANHPLPENATDAEIEAVHEAAARYAAHLTDDIDLQ